LDEGRSERGSERFPPESASEERKVARGRDEIRGGCEEKQARVAKDRSEEAEEGGGRREVRTGGGFKG